jgi:hypothetical protein
VRALRPVAADANGAVRTVDVLDGTMASSQCGRITAVKAVHAVDAGTVSGAGTRGSSIFIRVVMIHTGIGRSRNSGAINTDFDYGLWSGIQRRATDDSRL